MGGWKRDYTLLVGLEEVLQDTGRVNFILKHPLVKLKNYKKFFNISVKNTDDHLRNHGFLLTPQGWILSPAFDVNPVYQGKGLTLNISETDNSLDFDLASSVAKYFRVPGNKATAIISTVQQ